MRAISSIQLMILFFLSKVEENNGISHTIDPLIEVKLHELRDMKRCWRSGGVAVVVCRRCSQESLRSGLSTLRSMNETVVVHSMAEQFVSEKHSLRLIKTGADGKKEADQGSDSEEPAPRKESEDGEKGPLVECAVVDDFKCSQSAILSSRSDFKRFEQLGCRQLHGDLVISNFRFDPAENCTSLEVLERIHGRLIIHNSVGNMDLSFSGLVSIEPPRFHIDHPVLQITSNKLNSIRFPRLQTIGNQNVVIGGNMKFSDPHTMTPIYFKQKPLKSSFAARSHGKWKRGAPPNRGNPKNAVIKKYKILRRMDDYTIDWYLHFFPGHRIVHVLLMLAFVVVLMLLYVPARSHRKSKVDIMVEIGGSLEKVKVSKEKGRSKEKTKGKGRSLEGLRGKGRSKEKKSKETAKSKTSKVADVDDT